MGITDLRILGYALQLRWEWQRRIDPNSTLALLPSVVECRVTSMFSSSVTVEVGDRASTRFWTDSWFLDGAIRTFAPNLFKAVGRRRLQCSVKDALIARRWVRDIVGAPTAPVLFEYVQLWEKLETVHLRPLDSDRFIWRWMADGSYSVHSAYRAYFVGWTSMASAVELWRAAAPPKVKFFFWLALHG